MLSERDIELAHPEAFDFVFGQPARRPSGPSSTAISAVAATAKASSRSTATSARSSSNLPPHVEPPPGLEDRTVAAMVAALAEPARHDRSPD